MNTAFSNYIQDVADNNDRDIPEVWSPELWHADSRTGKMKKRRLENDDQLKPEEIITESEQTTYVLAPNTLLPVEEEKSENEDDNHSEIF